MTEAAFYQDLYARELDVSVTEVDGEWVVTDRTLFYPLGGGQPGDAGEFVTADGKRLRVVDTRKGEAGSIRHQMETAEHGLQPGDRVHQELDWDRRHRHMRLHTCLHLLGSLIPHGVTGGSIGDGRARLDFDAGDAELDKEALTTALNELIQARHPVEVETVEESVLDEKPDLVRTMSVAPPRGVGAVRMIRIPGVDYQPCGGTHVRNTGEIGAVRVSKIESKGKRNRRVQVRFEE